MTHVCAYLIEFKDGTGQYGLLHKGSFEECWKVYGDTRKIKYNGEKEVLDAQVKVIPEDEWNNFYVQMSGVPPSATRH